jgi:hypothetical protein
MTDGRPKSTSGDPGWRQRFFQRSFLAGLAAGTALGVIAALAGVAWRDEDPLEPGKIVIVSGRDDSQG